MRTTWVLDSDGHAAAPPAGNTPLEGFAELQDPKQLHRLGPQNLFFALSPSPSSQGVVFAPVAKDSEPRRQPAGAAGRGASSVSSPRTPHLT